MAEMLVTTVEVGIDVAGLEKHLHCSKAEIILRLSKGPESFAREVAKNPTYFHFYGSIDLDDLTEPASMAKFIKVQFTQLHKENMKLLEAIAQLQTTDAELHKEVVAAGQRSEANAKEQKDQIDALIAKANAGETVTQEEIQALADLNAAITADAQTLQGIAPTNAPSADAPAATTTDAPATETAATEGN